MKISHITQAIQHPFCDQLLNRGIINNLLVDNNSTFILHAYPDDHMDFLYRKMWELMFMRLEFRGGRKTVYNGNNMNSYDIAITTGEAISIIQNCTPSELKDQIPDAIRSFKNIKATLEELLVNDNPNQEYYRSVARKILHCPSSDMSMHGNAIDVKKIHKLIFPAKIPNGLIAQVVHSDLPLTDLTSLPSDLTEEPKFTEIQMLFMVNTSQSIMNLNRMVTNHNLKVLDIKKGENDVYYVMAYSPSLRLTVDVVECFSSSYKKFLG
jgi:hypothetical protein